MRIALDSNVMIYAEGSEDSEKRVIADRLIVAIHAYDLLIPIQAIGELRKWYVGKGRLTRNVAVARSSIWLERYETQASDKEVCIAAGELMSKHELQVWDSMILAAAWVGRASVLLSEDMQDGFKWRGVTVANPFAERPLKVVRDLLEHH